MEKHCFPTIIFQSKWSLSSSPGVSNRKFDILQSKHKQNTVRCQRNTALCTLLLLYLNLKLKTVPLKQTCQVTEPLCSYSQSGLCHTYSRHRRMPVNEIQIKTSSFLCDLEQAHTISVSLETRQGRVSNFKKKKITSYKG